jgi:cytochrome c556
MEQQKVEAGRQVGRQAGKQAKEMKSAEIRKAEEIKKSLRAVKRHSKKKSSMFSESGQDGIWQAAKCVWRATASQVWQGFQGMMQGLDGIKRKARQGEVHFADIPDTRMASALRAGVYRFFCKDDGFSFLVDMAELLPVDQRQAFIEDVLTRFRSVATLAAYTAC